MDPKEPKKEYEIDRNGDEEVHFDEPEYDSDLDKKDGDDY